MILLIDTSRLIVARFASEFLTMPNDVGVDLILLDILMQEIEDSRQGGCCGPTKGESLQRDPSLESLSRPPSTWQAEHQWLLSTWWWWGTSTPGRGSMGWSDNLLETSGKKHQKAMVYCNISEFPYSQPVTVLIPRKWMGAMGWCLLSLLFRRWSQRK